MNIFLLCVIIIAATLASIGFNYKYTEVQFPDDI